MMVQVDGLGGVREAGSDIVLCITMTGGHEKARRHNQISTETS